VLILGIIAFGMAIGAIAQLLVGRGDGRIDWGMAIVAGLVGSFAGGLLVSLLSGDGLALKPSGILGSLFGAIIITFIWEVSRQRRTAAARAEAKRQARSGRHH
jgi:uncharacterized membrane protein YeaQ/YmgE (transglycosylase-associated protein family)